MTPTAELPPTATARAGGGRGPPAGGRRHHALRRRRARHRAHREGHGHDQLAGRHIGGGLLPEAVPAGCGRRRGGGGAGLVSGGAGRRGAGAAGHPVRYRRTPPVGRRPYVCAPRVFPDTTSGGALSRPEMAQAGRALGRLHAFLRGRSSLPDTAEAWLAIDAVRKQAAFARPPLPRREQRRERRRHRGHAAGGARHESAASTPSSPATAGR